MLESLFIGGLEWIIALIGVIFGLFGFTMAGRRKAERDEAEHRAQIAEADSKIVKDILSARETAQAKGDSERAKDIENIASTEHHPFASQLHEDNNKDNSA